MVDRVREIGERVEETGEREGGIYRHEGWSKKATRPEPV